MSPQETPLITWFKDISLKDIPLVGGKNASLGEMYQHLQPRGVNIPNGFAITAAAYHYLLDSTGTKHQIQEILKELDTRDMANLARCGSQCREAILSTTFPPDLEQAIGAAYQELEKMYGPGVDVAVRSSATAEDLPDASFAGQQETYLNITTRHELLEACKKCFASLFTNRAISYREDKHFDHFSIGLSIAVQKMVRSDLASSGVMFSLDTESGFTDAVLITGAYGLGENIVQGAVNPDEFYVFKPTLKTGFKPIVRKRLGEKKIKMIYNHDGNRTTKNIEVDDKDRRTFILEDEEILTLARWAVIIEEHYSALAGQPRPMDMEWAKDGQSGELYIVQARPETVQARRDYHILEKYTLQAKGPVLVSGAPVGERIGSGPAKVIEKAADIGQFKAGEVLVTDMTDPDWEPIMKIASAIVTNRGGRTCHAAIISRELGIPCLVGTTSATGAIPTGAPVTVSCAEGERGFVYAGELPFTVERLNVTDIKRPRTKIMLNLGNPDLAFSTSFIPNDGVGLAREEFIINSVIKAHPLALLHPEQLDPSEQAAITDLTSGYHHPADFFVDQLAQGVGLLAAAFYPKDVIVRLSDFKSNEYANLLGGRHFEPSEDNPMIGWRGASRYYDPRYREAFALECAALKRVREEMGLTNVKIMIPFCRTVEEGRKVLAEMATHGLERGQNGLQVYVMCEIPSNVILGEEFAKIFDGFSIGSNDLTQLTLGLDRDSELVSHIYDERNEAVKTLIRQIIAIGKKTGAKVGICGQAPSDYPDFARFLAEEHIDSLSLNPDTVIKTMMDLAQMEEDSASPQSA